jgi:melibiose permease/lactose/raffinose/galactose permease
MNAHPSPTRNRWFFAVGTLGRDMVYALVAMFLIFFVTDILDLPDETVLWANWLLLAARLFDAVTDIIMGGIVDNTRTRWGQFKPWIGAGAVASGLLTLLLFSDLGVRGGAYVALFAVSYLLWSLAYTMNDIPYWSMLPSLSLDQTERERTGALARIFATIGLFTVVVGVIPITNALGGDATAWTIFAAGAVAVMLAGQAVTLLGVREPRLTVEQDHTSLRELAKAVVRNDQLLWTSVTMILFMTGYLMTTSFGVYFFKYAYGDEEMFSVFAAVLGFSQLVGFSVFPLLRRRLTRRQLYDLAMGLVLVGYVGFWFSPMNIGWLGLAGLAMFIGESFIVILILMFITDCIEYGHWKLGRRNTSVTFSLQPFVNKVSGALATAVVGATIVVTGINNARTPADVTPAGVLGMRVMMIVFPVVLIVVSYLVYRSRYRIDETFHARIVADLRERGELV